jgi:hypothetical protein
VVSEDVVCVLEYPEPYFSVLLNVIRMGAYQRVLMSKTG